MALAVGRLKLGLGLEKLVASGCWESWDWYYLGRLRAPGGLGWKCLQPVVDIPRLHGLLAGKSTVDVPHWHGGANLKYPQLWQLVYHITKQQTTVGKFSNLARYNRYEHSGRALQTDEFMTINSDLPPWVVMLLEIFRLRVDHVLLVLCLAQPEVSQAKPGRATMTATWRLWPGLRSWKAKAKPLSRGFLVGLQYHFQVVGSLWWWESNFNMNFLGHVISETGRQQTTQTGVAHEMGPNDVYCRLGPAKFSMPFSRLFVFCLAIH
jgi:hypothetical protein